MSDVTKTSIFLALALILVGLAFLTRPVVPEIKMDAMVGRNLFPKFTDPLAVKKLEIVKLNSSGGKENFRIAELDGVWTIPSHDHYPADAKEQMGKVAEGLADLNVVTVAAGQNEGVDVTTLHAMYGVIDPDSDSASLGEGVGIKVALAGANEEPLVNLIVGKPVEKGEAGPMGDESGTLHYVRIPGQTPVYTVAVDPTRFSTNFDQWIEKNLLDISTLDIKEIYVDEYSIKTEVQLTRRGAEQVASLNLIGDKTFTYDAAKTGPEKWTLVRWMGFKGQSQDRYEEEKLSPNQELNIETLDGMVSALNDLKIVSVSKKPAELAAALRAGKGFQELMNEGKAPESLGRCGFFLVPLEDPRGMTQGKVVRLLSNEGDVQLRMKDGIRYNLRFGDLTGTESEMEQSDSINATATTETPKMGANRYLFITAEFDADMVRKPEIQTVPDETPVEQEANETAAGKERSASTEERARIEKSNQREQDRYNREIEDGKKRADKLNDRFADWYYVISENVYKKIHLTEATVFRAKTPSADETADEPAAGKERSTVTENEEPKPELPDLPGTTGLFQNPNLVDKPVSEPETAPASSEETPEAVVDEQKADEMATDETATGKEQNVATDVAEAPEPFDPFGGKSPSE